MTKRIAMWSGPRNISTAMMRSFQSREDTLVSDEPMYGHFLAITKTNHPLREEVIDSMEINREKLHKHLSTFSPAKYRIWYQKQMTQHILIDDNLEWTQKLTNAFLIRDPKQVILSYLKKFKLEDESLIGFIQLKRIFDYVVQNIDSNPVVIDANDILKNPLLALDHLCKALKISYTDKMLSWEKGYKTTDGVWASHWYNNVVNTNKFISFKKNKDSIPKEYLNIYRKSMDIYNQLHDYRIKF
jgi:23S rRNA maturation mini-RNase III